MTRNIKVGDLIKSYHFEPMSDRPDRYIIGRVTDVLDGMIHFWLLADVVEHPDLVEYEIPSGAFQAQVGDAQRVLDFLATTGKECRANDAHPDLPNEMRTPLRMTPTFDYQGRVTVLEAK